MRLPYILLLLVVPNSLGAMFRVTPAEEQVVRRGTEVTLECVTNQDVQFCAWKMIEVPGLPPVSGFLTAGIPRNIEITARDPASKRDCSIVISSTEDRHNGTYRCAPYVEGSQVEANDAHVIVARKPDALEYLGDQPLVVTGGTAVSVQCEARGAQPRAEVAWYLDNEQLYDNPRTETAIEVTDAMDDNGLWTSVSQLTHAFSWEDNGKKLRCRANHMDYDESDEQRREKSTDIDVRFAAYRPQLEPQIGCGMRGAIIDGIMAAVLVLLTIVGL